MSKILREQLSAFLDDELHTAELELVARRVVADADLRATAFRYSLIGDALRGELACADPMAFVRGVASHTLDAAPTVPPAWAGWGRSLAGAGLAAAVAVVAVLVLRDGEAPGGDAPVTTVPVAEESPIIPSYTVPSAYSRRAGAPDQLSRYYLNHSEYALMLGGQAPLVRIVSGPTPDVAAVDDGPPSDPTPPGAVTEP